MSVMEHLDKHECVYKLSRSVKTNRGVGKIALTQQRLFLLAEGRPGYVEISTFRNIEVRAGLWLPAVGLPLHAAPAEPCAPARTVISLTASLSASAGCQKHHGHFSAPENSHFKNQNSIQERSL